MRSFPMLAELEASRSTLAENGRGVAVVGTVDGNAPDVGATPRKWWQWFLIYPAIGVAVLGAVPSLVELVTSYRIGVPFGHSADAQGQRRLWESNFECLQKAVFSSITNRFQVEIGSVVCPSGDVLLRCNRPGWQAPHLRWVSWNDVVGSENQEKVSWLNALGRPARAEGSSGFIHTQVAVVCTRWVGNGLLLQRLAGPYGCFDQVINTYNGFVVSSRPAPCAPC